MEQDKNYVNYHKHTSLSNVYIKDSSLLPSDYWDELKKRYGSNQCIYTTVEHYWQGNYFKLYDDLEKYNKKNNTNIKFVFGVEAGFVKDRFSKDRAGHMILLAKNDNGRKKINKILSTANKDGYYFNPRIDIDLIMKLPPKDVFITSACIALWKRYSWQEVDEIMIKLNNYFPHFYLEAQAHNTEAQIELNKHLLELSKKYGMKLIAGVDSHVIDNSQLADRDDLLKSSKIFYEDEQGWYIDYPTYDILFQRFKEQNIFTDEEIYQFIENTNVIYNFENIVLDRSLKVPSVKQYKDLSKEERDKIFKNYLKYEWENQYNDINKDKLKQYKEEIKHDMNEIIESGMSDYFILNYLVIKLGQEKYGGILTPSGRGSAVSMYLNKLLKFTKVDKVNSPVLMYSERFLTKERILESHTPPDIDHNLSDREPFIKAQKELLGDLSTYDLLALGTLHYKSAFKMYARAYNLDPQIANQVTRQIDRYEKALKYAEEDEKDLIDIYDYVDEEYKSLIDGCQYYRGIVDTRKGHPCGCICYDGDVEEDVGIILCKSETTGKEVLTAVIESGTIDSFGYLKQDYLIVDSIGLTYDIYKEIGIEPFTVNQLLDIIKDDKKVWDIYAKGYTMCVNQCEQEKATQKIMKYKPKNISELTQFVAAIRPSFKSMYHKFENREHFEYGIKALDILLQDEYCDSSFILYQENLMKVLGFAGFPMSETYNIIKAISKKKKYVIEEAKDKFIPNFAKAILDTKETDNVEIAKELSSKVWQIVEDSAAYGFNSAHAYCMAVDSVTIAYLKAYYPLEFYKIVLQRFTNKGEKDKVSLLKKEMLKREIILQPIKFGKDNRCFIIEKETNSIIQTMSSIKGMPKIVPEILYEHRNDKFNNKFELYNFLINESRINKTGLEILIGLDYFSEFVDINQMYSDIEIFKKYYGSKTLNKEKLNELELKCIKSIKNKETAKQFKDFDSLEFIKLIIQSTPIQKTTIFDKIKYQVQYLGYTNLIDNKIPSDICVVLGTETNNWGSTFVNLYRIYDGFTKQFRANKKNYGIKCPTLETGDIIRCSFKQKQKQKMIGQDENGKNIYEKLNEYFNELNIWGKI